METELGTGLLFIAHVDLGSRIFTDQHNSKTRLYAPLGQLGNFPGNVDTNFVRYLFTADDCCCHVILSPLSVLKVGLKLAPHVWVRQKTNVNSSATVQS
ncbi:hypothetical protein D3C87_1721280 [compost metagenome]